MSTTTKTATSLLPTSFAVPAFLVGPALSIALVRHMATTHYLPAAGVVPALLVALFMWSPSPISIPAMVLQDVRDSYGASMRGIAGTLKRGGLLTFWLASKNSPVRVEMVASLVGFALAVAMVVLHVAL